MSNPAELPQQPLEQQNVVKGDAQFPTTADLVKPGDGHTAADVAGKVLSDKDFESSMRSVQDTKSAEIFRDPNAYQQFHANLNNVVATAIASDDVTRMTRVQDAMQAHILDTQRYVGDRPALISKLDDAISQDLSPKTSA